MKKNLQIFFYILSFSCLFGQDYSTPEDGNLFIDRISPFSPENITIYNDTQIFDTRNITLKNNRIYKKTPGDIQQVPGRTLNSDIAWIDDATFVVLTGNSDRYRHGILGDKIESSGFALYKNDIRLSKYELPENRVFETLRPLVADIIPENPGKEIILTSSNENEGARVDVYSQRGILLGHSPPIGQGYRWLHILGAASFKETPKQYIALVKTPHINGILELLFWNGTSLEREVSLSNNLSTHQIGSSNLNMALLINSDSTPESEIFVPTSDFRNLFLIKYTGKSLEVIKKFELPSRIITNLYFEDTSPASIWIGLSNGSIARIYE